MPRFHIATPLQALASGATVELPEEVVRHLQVLRLQTGDAVTLFDGTGGEYPATLGEIGKRHAAALLGEHQAREVEPPYAVTLVQGIAGGDKMDWLIEKAIELGVRRVVPLVTVRSVVRLSGERAQRRAEHWRALACAACEQCGRNRVPQIDAPAPLDRWLDSKGMADGPLRLMLSPRAQGSLELLPEAAPAVPVELLIGPEGGLSADEETAALAAGYLPISLGSRILRTETAGLAMLAALATRWGGW
ncbi:16S rRNA (uracil(1498)-N(3))-methyltransferase [Pararobbsia alpina]|uniref:Ribosomal RNA small subunit methyltransferase E n=1 Tax=Pararobbsia alpina TaxID=621374 RepID=A0A6S7BZ41_9BURK|nr:16S rRNA (uracil(1498)-N(3))-methyltransferase [Pararobbsia alpina]CAB3777300.1 Ribosomal RNA small subunit methyltransferase E [Pararobbsia alpina]